MADDSKSESNPPPRGGQYYLMEKIAQGGMAEIFKGLSYDIHGLKRTVCIKKILPHIAASREFIDSLIDEAKIAVTLSHGNIAQVHDLGKVGDDYFIVMEYVEGKSLSHIAKKTRALGTPIPVPIVCWLLAEISSGLDYIHRRPDEHAQPLNIVHRDISPQNIVVSYSGTVKIIDFGIAIVAGRMGITDSGILKGKFSYMSPEQARGDTLDSRSDIFSLGVIMHELLTGQRLFKAEDNRETLRNVRRAHVDPPSTLRPDLPDDIDRICLRGLARDRRHRFPTAAVMRDQLLKFLHTTYPTFQPSDAAIYVRDLFHDELSKPTEEDEIKTPHLIIDATHSALTGEREQEPTHHAEAPVDLDEFLIEPAAERDPHPPDMLDDDHDERTTRWKKHRLKALTLVSVSGALMALAIAIHLYRSSPPQPETAALPSPPPVTPPQPLPVEKPQSPIGTVTLESEPAGAKVYIDDGPTDLMTPTKIDHIKPGKHTFGLFLENYRFWEREAEVMAGEVQHFDIQLVKDYASLVVTTQPAGALVMLGGLPMGTTPLERHDLEAGKVFQVEVWLEGFNHITRDIKGKAGRTEELHFILEKESP